MFQVYITVKKTHTKLEVIQNLCFQIISQLQASHWKSCLHFSLIGELSIQLVCNIIYSIDPDIT